MIKNVSSDDGDRQKGLEPPDGSLPPEYIRNLQQELQNEIEGESPRYVILFLSLINTLTYYILISCRKGKDDLIDFNMLGLEDNRADKDEVYSDGQLRSTSKDSSRSITEDIKNNYGGVIAFHQDDDDDDEEVKLNVMQSPFPTRINNNDNNNDKMADQENSLSPIKSSDIFRIADIDAVATANSDYADKEKNHEENEKRNKRSQSTHNEKDSSDRDTSYDKKKKSSSIYYRIVGKRKHASAHGVTKVCDDPEASLSTISNLKDKFWSFMAGESDLERLTRLRLQWYKGLLQSELIVLERAKTHHRQHGQNLAQDFENQELQLQKWGLLNILPAFRMQAWVRVSRASLLEDMSILATRLLQSRADRADRVINQFNDTSVSRKYPLSSYNEFCQLPEGLMHKDANLQVLAHRLAKIDRICSASLHKFRTLLPELESRTYVQRRHMLNDILNGYTKWLDASEPTNIDDDMTWPEFCDWYSKRNTEMTDLEKEYGIFVEDEREREGRLFRRWCLLVLAGTSFSSEDNLKSSSADNSGDGLLTSSVRASLLSPRSILAFIKYFAINIIASRYGVTSVNQEALLALTESLVFRRVNLRIFKYPSQSLQERDIKWRKKCTICRYIDPTIYGVPPEYAFANKEKTDNINEPVIEIDPMSLALSPVSLSFSQRLQMLFEYKDGQFGAPYARASRVMSLISSSITSRDITFNLLMSLKWLLKDGQLLSGKKEFLGADLMFPILVQVIINSQIPSMHLVLHFLHNFGTFLHVGEAAYYSTCLEAAVAYILRMEVDPEVYKHIVPIVEEELNPLPDDDGAESYAYANDTSGIAKLGEWLRDQQTMEDTMSILQSEGWMV